MPNSKVLKPVSVEVHEFVMRYAGSHLLTVDQALRKLLKIKEK